MVWVPCFLLMSDNSRQPVMCPDCEAVPRLHETPYSGTDYIVACECDNHAIDVSDPVNSSVLVQPFSGKWCNIDHDYENR